MSTVPQPLDPPRLSRTTLLVVAAHAALWLVWLLVLFWFVPPCERIFRDFNLKLPVMTELVVALTHGIVPLALLVVPVFLAVDAAVYFGLRRSGAGWVGRALWSSLMTVVPVVVVLVTAVAVWIPMLKLQEALSK